MQTVGILLFAYLLGSVPTGLVLGFLSGVDVRQGGSGNIGASNVVRLVGWKAGLITLLFDTAKGFVPVVLSAQLNFDPEVQALTALAAFFGHLFPVFLRFRGGKGVATALGILFVLAPWVVMALILVFCLVVLATRWISLASLTAAVFAPALVWVLSYQVSVLWATLIMGVFIILRHHENIKRLCSGTEPKLKLRS